MKKLNKIFGFIATIYISTILLSSNIYAVNWDTPADATQVLNSTRWNLVVSKMIELDTLFINAGNIIDAISVPLNDLSSKSTTLTNNINTTSGSISDLNTNITNLNNTYNTTNSTYSSLNTNNTSKISTTTANTNYVRKSVGGTLSGPFEIRWLRTGYDANPAIIGNNANLLESVVKQKGTAVGPHFRWIDINGYERLTLDVDSGELLKKGGKLYFTNTGSTVNDGSIGPSLINTSGLDIVGIGNSVSNRKINIFGNVVVNNNLLVNGGVIKGERYKFGDSGNNLEINGKNGITTELPDGTSKIRFVNDQDTKTFLQISGSGNIIRKGDSGENLFKVNPVDDSIVGAGTSLQVGQNNTANTYTDFLKIITNTNIASGTNNRGIDLIYTTTELGNGNNCGSMIGSAAGCRKIMTIDSGFNGTTTNQSVITLNGNISVTSDIPYSGDETKFYTPIEVSSGVVKLGSFASDPVGGANGQMYYNTTINQFKCYKLASWNNCGNVVIPVGNFIEQSNFSNLIYNGDFEVGSGSYIGSSSLGGEQFGRKSNVVGGGYVAYDKSVFYKGSGSLKLENTGTNSYIELSNAGSNGYFGKNTLSIRVKGSTQYKLSAFFKTEYVSGIQSGNGVKARIGLNDGSNNSKGEYSCAGYVNITQDRKLCSVTFTTTSDTELANIMLRIYGHSGGNDLKMRAWFDDVKLEEVSNIIPDVNVGTPTGGEICLGRYCNQKRNGLSKNNSSFSCNQIKKDYSSSVTGLYRIKPTDDLEAKQIYCDMTSDGGGWGLAVRIVPSAGNLHSSSLEVGGIVLPTGATIAKLSDEYINKIANEKVFKLTCDNITNYFKITDNIFSGTHRTDGPKGDISWSTTYAGAYTLGGHSASTYYGLSSYINTSSVNVLGNNHINYVGMSNNLSGCRSIDRGKSGTLWVR